MKRYQLMVDTQRGLLIFLPEMLSSGFAKPIYTLNSTRQEM
ncbi:hypothetical protein [Sulfoacidibacillus ferrooxidans]|nr:hypothetical protein [Sulfoacidibacillus ferrooxidans]